MSKKTDKNLASRKLENEEIAERLEQRRTELKLKKVDIAKFCGVSSLTILNWFDGSHSIKSKHIFSLANILQTTPEFIVLGNSYSDSNKYTGMNPEIMDEAIDLVFTMEFYNRERFSSAEFKSKLKEAYYRFSNNDRNIEIVDEKSLLKETMKKFVKELNIDCNKKDLDSALNIACASVASTA